MTTILLVEDTFDLAQVIVRELEALGYEVLHAADGLVALELHARHQPDLVILDWMLPRLDDLEVLRPGLGFHVAIPWGQLLKPVAMAYLASWLILAIHTWVALRWRSFVVASAVGIVPTVAGVVIINSEWGNFYPWVLAGLIISGFNKGEALPLIEFLLGSLGGVVAALVGGWEVTRHDAL